MSRRKILLPVLLSGLMVACGGGGGGSTTPPVSTTLSGTAAAGAPIIGTVTVKGALGNTRSEYIEADGSYDVDVTGLTAPYRLRAEGTVGGRTYKLHSYAVEGDVGNTVNITPFTDLIVANVAGQIAESYFDDNGAVAELDSAEIDAQESELQAKLQDVFDVLGLDTAIDLLNSSFSADHSGLDAALDLVRVEVDSDTNQATITNLIENTTLTDSFAATEENDVLAVDPNKSAEYTTAVSDTQAIAQKLDALEALFANGLPTAASIQDFFADDFYAWDESKSQFITIMTTDPTFIDNTFSGITVTNLDTNAGTAEVTFSFGKAGIIEVEPIKWFFAKDATLGWQARGDQRIAETYFSYHCNDYDGTTDFPRPNTDGSYPGDCGINTQFWDKIFTNNCPAADNSCAAIASGTVEIIDPTNPTVPKATIYLGTPPNGTAGDVQVYSPQNQNFQWDWMSFSEIAASTYAAGDTIRYSLYTEDLDISTPTAPAIAAAATPVDVYTDTILFAPESGSSALAKLPTVTAATKTAMQNFTLGNSLTVEWVLAAGTRNEEVKLEISDSEGNRIEIWDWTLGSATTSITFSSSQLSATAASSAGLLDTDTTYDLKIRVYAENPTTGQSHSRDYDVVIPGPAAGGGDNTAPAPDFCNTTGVTSLAEFISTVEANCTVTSFADLNIEGKTYNFAGSAETYTFNVGNGTQGTGTFLNDSGTPFDFAWQIDANGMLGVAYNAGFNDYYAIVGGDASSGYNLAAITDETLNAGETPTFNEVFVEVLP